MKTLKSLLMMGLVALALSSCNKDDRRALKDIEGTWSISSVMTDGQPDQRDFSGTYDFEDCKYRTNKKEGCDCQQDITVTYMGNSETSDTPLRYRVHEDGKKLTLDDAVYDLELNDNTMTWSLNDGTNNQVVTLTRQ